ncbi:hypothetical protein M9458_043614, partial [Cirrhinus mrigala]
TSHDGNRSMVSLERTPPYTTTESREVAACTAEPPEAAASAAVSSEAMMPTAVSPEVAAYPAEPHKMGTSLCAVLAPSDTLPVHELSVRPVTAMETLTELSAHPVTAIEAIYKLLSCPEPIYEL